MLILNQYISRVGAFTIALSIVQVSPALSQTPRAQVARDVKWERQLVKQYPCTIAPRSVHAAKGISRPLACALSLAAIREVREGRARELGLSPADTSVIQSVSVNGLYLHGLGGATDEAFWSVKIDFGQVRPMLDVRFDRVRQSITPFLAEGRGGRR